jgi:Xaa-Pro aminopeptidase
MTTYPYDYNIDITFSHHTVRKHESGRLMAVDEQRCAANVAALKRSSLHALICSSSTSVLLLTGYWPVMGGSVAVATTDGRVFVIIPEDERELAQAVGSAQIITYTPETLGRLEPPIHALSATLGSLLRSLSLSNNVGTEFRLGMQPASYLSSHVFHTSLIDQLESFRLSARFVSADTILDTLKATKTSKELSLIRRSAEVASHGFAIAAKCVKPGLRESEVAAEIQSAFDRSPRAEGLERSYGAFYCMSGPNSAKASAAYARTRQRTLCDGDLVMIHANTCADGYWTDITRTYIVGAPDTRQRDMQDAIAEARSAAIDAVRPGVKASRVDQVARDVMTAHGFGAAFRHSTGHGVGFAAADANAHPRIHPRSPDVLEEGMTFNIEPAAYFDEYGGMRHCDMVAVTATGASVITDF